MYNRSPVEGTWKKKDFDIQGISSIADKCAYVTAKVARVEEAAPRASSSKYEDLGEIVEPDVIVKNDYDDWVIEDSMMVKKVKTSGLRAKMWVLQKNCCSIGVEVSADRLSVVALAKRGMNLERQLTKLSQALVEVEEEFSS